MDDDNYVTLTDEGIAEISPTASRDQQMAFIDTYRQMQGENTAQIGEAAHALGSDLTAQYGGLHGPSEYMKSRYQTPQTESRIAGLRTTAQLAALNQLMQNDLTRMKNRYSQAYRAAQKRARTGGSSGGGGDLPDGGGDGLQINTTTGAPESIDVNVNPNTGEGNIVPIGEGAYKNVSTGETYRNAPTPFMSLSEQGLSLGVWPDGSPLTLGSTYTQGGKTYTYQKVGNMATPSVFVVGG